MAPATNLLAHVYSVPMLNIGEKKINTELKTGKKKKHSYKRLDPKNSPHQNKLYIWITR
jgi:hypothetical protein